MILIDHLRKAILNGDGSRLRAILLTHDQAELVRYIATRGSVRTSDIVEAHGVSTQCASSKLSKLACKGYLVRLERSAVSGGIEYVYRVKAGLM